MSAALFENAPGIQKQLLKGAVPNDILNVCPPGTKLHILNVGYLAADAGWFLRAGNTSTASSTCPQHERRDLVMYCCLIEHPIEGLILWETGCGKDYPEVWGAPLNDIFARSKYEPCHELDAAIAATGNDIKDIKMVIIGHLHLDHAGGLDVFRNTGIPVYVHDEELKHAFWAIATGCDKGVYLEYYMKFDINFQTFHESAFPIAQGLTLHHLPGHTPGLCGLQINLPNDGTFIFTSDMFHVKENMQGVPQGWLARDHNAWFRSLKYVLSLGKRTRGQIIPGHDKDIVDALWAQKSVWT